MSQPTRPVWEKRPNMGASPIAIQAAEAVLKDLGGAPNYRGITIAAHVDAAFRKAKVPELFAATERLKTASLRISDHRHACIAIDDEDWSELYNACLAARATLEACCLPFESA